MITHVYHAVKSNDWTIFRGGFYLAVHGQDSLRPLSRSGHRIPPKSDDAPHFGERGARGHRSQLLQADVTMAFAFVALMAGVGGALYIVLEALFIYPKPSPKSPVRESYLLEVNSRWLRVVRIGVGLVMLGVIVLLTGLI